MKIIKTPLSIFLAGFAISFHVNGQTNSLSSPEISGQKTVETLVCVRHGEKPPGGLGQLNCRGLNRALALPDVLLKKYGAPKFVFAPNPTQKADGGAIGKYYYVRPLMTIEPTAIRCDLPVNTEFGYLQIKRLEKELEKQKYRNAVVFIAWEHGALDELAKNLLKDNGGNPAQVPRWPENDYDTIFIFKITRDAGRESLAFTIDHEGLNGLSDKCP
ncbi:MAG: hypothetical protein ACREDS_04075 [Limisphaerales bacterium]